VAKRGRPKSKLVLNVGEDPTVWRFASLNEALSASPILLARLIQYGEQLTDKPAVALPEPAEEKQE